MINASGRRSILVPLLALLTAAAALAVTPAKPAQAAKAENLQKPKPEVRLGRDVLPTFESIRLRVDPKTADYSGEVTVDLAVHRSTRTFGFHAQGEEIRSFRLTRASGPGTSTAAATATSTAAPIGLRRKSADVNGFIEVETRAALPPGDYRLEIAFRQHYNTQAVGLYRTEKEGRSYAFTQLEASDARRAFPCWDEPAIKIPYQLTVEIPAAEQAVSNTPVAQETGAGEWKRLVFEKTPPLPAYLLALAVGPLEFTPLPGLSVPARVVTVQGQGQLAAAAVELTPPLLAGLERWFDQPYPYRKLDLVAVPEFWPGGMENPGAIFFAEPVLLLDAKASDKERETTARIIAHELAHMWFGDLVTTAWWDDLWLNESFADWMADKITDQTFPAWRGGALASGDINTVMQHDARPSTAAVRQPVMSPTSLLQNVSVAYGKGKAVLGMFEAYVGPEAFRGGVNSYLRAHAWGNATASDLWTAVSQAAGQDLSPAMASFLDQPGLPLVRAELLKDGRVHLSQERFLSGGATAAPLLWQVPVGIKYGDGQTVHSRTVLLAGREQTVSLPEGSTVSWVLPDLSALGYYRWSLPEAQLTALAAAAAERLTAEERINLSN
ncbi:MAG TPA: M1 family metallopeptidase, partial [Thermoanaerobaculia bacterium]|nr:M1 family metallopeptidase [Thermoanaerobaculia bacterium]